MVLDSGRKVVGILQARTGSTRLPGKVLMSLADRTILAHCIERMRESDVLDDIVVATTTLERDDEVVAEALRNGASCFRGSEEDVLARYVGAATAHGAAVVVRVTADNPLTDPVSLGRCVRELLGGGHDYVAEGGLPIGAASEALTTAVLAAMAEATSSPPHREHVTLYLKENPGGFRLRLLSAESKRSAPLLRLTVDTVRDLERLRWMLSEGLLSFYPYRLSDLLTGLRGAVKSGAIASDTVDGMLGSECALVHSEESP